MISGRPPPGAADPRHDRGATPRGKGSAGTNPRGMPGGVDITNREGSGYGARAAILHRTPEHRANRGPPHGGRPVSGPDRARGGILDPITHSFTGGALSAAGLRRASRLATPTLVVAANAPDVDILAMLWGPYTALAWRRGLTHGIPALVVLPFLVVGAVVLVDRVVLRMRGLERPAPRVRALLALATLGVATHPILDWINTYGMRWLVPFDGSWSYGDAVFILDPWFWLLLGGPVFLVGSRTRLELVSWSFLAGFLSLPVLLADIVPPWARVAWLAGLGGWVLLRVRAKNLDREATNRSDGIARGALLVASAYLLLMVAATPVAENVVAAEAREQLGLNEVASVMVGPLPADPLGGQVIVESSDAYWTGTFRWLRRPHVDWDAEPIERGEASGVVDVAREHPDARGFLVWSRFPLHRVTPHAEGWWVEFRDARHLDPASGSLAGVRVFVHPDLGTASEAMPVGAH